MEISTVKIKLNILRPKGRKKVEAWLIKNKKVLKVLSLERELGIQRGSIQKFLKYDRKLDDSIIKALEEYIKGMC
ncbi:hypothetical protein [Aquimarina algiphila]|uniref:XRE family transcriptional regulator n=1 Tax=Aquimarina algiphila TaxID=2047982 RepID=A0A554VC66_9FLAO|nr:hypothetical protein [Aquimarina algiphila]TSE04266.1 hypothetical protein FOF46_26790 [Aquimarina algiphila]